MARDPAALFRFRLQFRMKSLLLILTGLGVFLGQQVNKARWQREAVEGVERLGGRALYDDQVSGEIVLKRSAGVWRTVGPRVDPTRPQCFATGWLERLIGADFFADVVYVDLSATAVSDQDLARLRGLPRLRFLSLANTRVTDAGLQSLAELTRLERLDLSGTQASDACLPDLGKLTNLIDLRLGSTMSTLGRLDQATHVTDAGLRRLCTLKRLRLLDLSGTQIGDGGIVHLHALRALKYVDLRDTRTTATGRLALQRTNPGLAISADDLELAAAP
jgi:Leucine Rich Repeat (LRR) protein